MTSTETPEQASDRTPAESRSRIDPRMHERRVTVLRAQGRRRLRILLGVLTAGCVLGLAWLVVHSPLLAVSSVSVRGAHQESAATIARVGAVHDGDATLFVDGGAVARRVEALPWIERATVSRNLPHGITISVVERAPVAWVRRPAAAGAAPVFALVDRSGRVLADVGLPPAGLAELVGVRRTPPPGHTIAPMRVAAALMSLPDGLRAQVSRLVLDDDTAVLSLAAPPNGAAPAAREVRLGRLEDTTTKGRAALAVLDALAGRGQRVAYVDVHVPEAPATG